MDGGVFFFSSRRRHTRYWRDWSSDVCSSDLGDLLAVTGELGASAAGLLALEGAAPGPERLLRRHLRPEPRVEAGSAAARSEERRGGKECRSRWSPDY